jgi:hypothetical protein
MKKQIKMKYESSTLLIIVSIAFIISLGFIYWQNFIYDEPELSTDPLTSANLEAAEPKQTRFLTLDNWSVRVPLKDASYYYRSGDYKTISSTDQKYEISTRSLRVACGTDNATIGTIERVLASEDNDSKIGASDVKGTKVLGKYLYIFTAPHSTCSASPDVLRLQENATKEFIPLLSGLAEVQ